MTTYNKSLKVNVEIITNSCVSNWQGKSKESYSCTIKCMGTEIGRSSFVVRYPTENGAILAAKRDARDNGYC